MTGTFKFDPKTETFVFRVDGKSASVSWNGKARLFEAWETTETGVPVKISHQPTTGGLFRALMELWRTMDGGNGQCHS